MENWDSMFGATYAFACKNITAVETNFLTQLVQVFQKMLQNIALDKALLITSRMKKGDRNLSSNEPPTGF